MAKPKILVIEDERPLVEVLTYNLEREGFEVLAAYDGQTFTAPSHAQDLNSFTSVTLTDTSGHTRPLGDWTHFERIMTSDGTAHGNTEITPGPLSFDGKSFGLTVK